LLSSQAKVPYEEMAARSMKKSVDGIAASNTSRDENKKRAHFEMDRLHQANTHSSSKSEDDMEGRKIQGKKINTSHENKSLNPLFSMLKDQKRLNDEDFKSKLPASVILPNSESRPINIEGPPKKNIVGHSCAVKKPKIAEGVMLQSFSEHQTIAVASDPVSMLPSHITEGKDSMVGFRVFVQHLHPLILQEYSYLSAEDVMKVLNSVWLIMPDIERQYYTNVEQDEDAFHEASKYSFGKR
jgi:Tfp pilus assembly major pilin PilA